MVNSNDFWDQNCMAYVGQGYHKIMYAENQVSGYILQIHILCWSRIYTMSMYATN